VPPLQQLLLDLLLLQDAELRQLTLSKLQLLGNNHGSTPLVVAAAAASDCPGVFCRLLEVANADVLEARTKQGEAGLLWASGLAALLQLEHCCFDTQLFIRSTADVLPCRSCACRHRCHDGAECPTWALNANLQGLKV
jgi:hypothetical protein